MSALLLVTKRIHERPSGGREMLCKLNRDCLRDIYGDDLSVLELESSRMSSPRAICCAVRGYLDGVSAGVIDAAVEQIRNRNIGCVFIDGSNLGEIAAGLRRRRVVVKIATFFHNVESCFFLGSLKASRTPRSLAVLAANYLAEQKAVRHSDVLIAMTEQDSALLGKVYGRSATHISAIALDEKGCSREADDRSGVRVAKDSYLLFVGGAFYANRQGVAWFAQNVAPRIDTKTFVVGKGLETLKPGLEKATNVEVVGGVQDLAPWYLGAHCVIAPIFHGSGMKTKVAEAMMFGKKVIGTPAAFCGYEDVAGRAGWICATADEFVNIIQLLEKIALPRFDPEARALFEANYSYAAARLRLARILEPLTQSESDGTRFDQKSSAPFGLERDCR
jgi:polysaccharide biosynthesis protein PslH